MQLAQILDGVNIECQTAALVERAAQMALLGGLEIALQAVWAKEIGHYQRWPHEDSVRSSISRWSEHDLVLLGLLDHSVYIVPLE